jgi:hypothetical protein
MVNEAHAADSRTHQLNEQEQKKEQDSRWGRKIG